MSFPADLLKAAHGASIFNQQTIAASSVCACFDCLESFPPAWINDWIDEGSERPKTARCPHCANDAVLCDASGFPVTDASFMAAMNRHWCNSEDDDA